MGKSETEYESVMRHYKKRIYQWLSAIITFNIGNVHHQKGKQPDTVLMMSHYKSFFTGTDGPNKKFTKE